jgi:hypothetical protein
MRRPRKYLLSARTTTRFASAAPTLAASGFAAIISILRPLSQDPEDVALGDEGELDPLSPVALDGVLLGPGALGFEDPQLVKGFGVAGSAEDEEAGHDRQTGRMTSMIARRGVTNISAHLNSS